MTHEVENLINYCRVNDRVCPLPNYWNQLWELLPNKKHVGHGWKPSAPLILAAWHEASDLMKMERLSEHLKWADQHDVIDIIYDFLYKLKEEDWHHLDK